MTNGIASTGAGKLPGNHLPDKAGAEKESAAKSRKQNKKTPLWRHPVTLLLLLTALLWLSFLLKIILVDSKSSFGKKFDENLNSTIDNNFDRNFIRNDATTAQNNTHQSENASTMAQTTGRNQTARNESTGKNDPGAYPEAEKGEKDEKVAYIEALHESFANKNPATTNQIIRGEIIPIKQDKASMSSIDTDTDSLISAMKIRDAELTEQLSRALEQLVDDPEQLKQLNHTYRRALNGRNQSH